MKIWTLSDLHLDHSPLFPIIPDADVCIVAGEIMQGAIPVLEWLRHEISPHMPVVLGNHEFYGSSIERQRALAAEYADHSGIYLLDDSSVNIDGVRFVGSTLWTDFEVFAAGDERLRHEHMYVSQAWVNDFKLIMARDFSSDPFTPRLSRELHQWSRAYLDDTLAVPFDGPTVVVTHHAPSPKSIAREYADSRHTPSFVSDLDDLIRTTSRPSGSTGIPTARSTTQSATRGWSAIREVMTSKMSRISRKIWSSSWAIRPQNLGGHGG